MEAWAENQWQQQLVIWFSRFLPEMTRSESIPWGHVSCVDGWKLFPCSGSWAAWFLDGQVEWETGQEWSKVLTCIKVSEFVVIQLGTGVTPHLLKLTFHSDCQWWKLLVNSPRMVPCWPRLTSTLVWLKVVQVQIVADMVVPQISPITRKLLAAR